MDTVIARQHPHDPDLLQWRVDPSSGEPRFGEGRFAELARTCEDARLLWLVPSEDVLLTEVTIPNRRELNRATPYVLEDELAEDVENLHFAFGKAEDNDPVPVAVVSRERLQAWLTSLESNGLYPHALVPDVLALPLTEGHVSLLLEGRRGLLRTGPACGLVADDRAFEPLLLTALEAASTTPAGLDVWRCGETRTPIPRPAGTPVKEQPCTGNPLTLIPAAWGRYPPLNLLQGAFRSRRLARRHAPWWIAAALAAGWLLLTFAQDLLQYSELRHLRAEYQGAMRTLYLDTFPDASRVPDPRLLMEQRLETFRASMRGGTGTSFLTMLDTAGGAITDLDEVRINLITFRNGRLELELETGDAGTLEQIKQSIQANGLNASLQSVDTQGSRVVGRLNVEQTR
ncbi:MAG: hypothetical protein HUJ28_13095 [Chromatiales bacterium]|nr:hypothetical protein [Chromatiales bacterium]